MSKDLAKENYSSKWKYITLDDAVEKGSSNISLNKVKDDDGDYPLFSAKGFNKNISFYHQEKEYLAIIKDGAGIGRVSKHPAKSSVVATMQYLIPKDGFDIGFIQYFLKGIDFESHRQGSTIPHVYFKDYKVELFPSLKLTQQKEIVAILDKAFAAIDQAKANAQQNLQNAKELFESYLQSLFENKGDDWEEKTLNEISESIFAGGDKPKENFSKEENLKFNIPIFANAVKKRGLYGFTNKARVLKPSITISARGSGTGHTELRNESYYPIVRLIVVIPNSEIMDLKFLKHTIDSLDILRSGSAIPQLTVPMMKKYKISFPPINKQTQIVNKLESLSAQTKKLEAQYTQKIADLEELKKSVLQKAFSGQLN
jgi:type I restriction enzyme S subunit